jgi:hypothetical protein
LTSENSKPKKNTDEFYDQAWQIVLKMKKEEEGKDRQFELYKECESLFTSLQSIPNKENNVNYNDLFDFFTVLSLITKKNFAEITLDDLKKSIDLRILGEPFKYSFYFNIGTTGNFPVGYQIGYGKLYPLSELSDNLKNYISSYWEHDFPYEKKFTKNLAEFMTHRKSEWFVHIVASALGHYKATEKAIEMMNKSMNIYKMIYHIHSFHSVYSKSSFDYYYETGKGGMGSGSRHDPMRGPNYVRVEFFDDQITKFNEILNSDKKTELEKRLVNAADIYGLIDDFTPLHVAFVLCIFSLETLLMGNSEKDYLGWKLSEKITFLLGDKPAWFHTLYEIEPANHDKVDGNFMRENLAEARARLFKKVSDLYNKRSTFAHSGSGEKKKDRISEPDYRLASCLLSWTVQVLLELREKGVEYIEVKDSSIPLQDNGSLNTYVEKLKYSNEN